MSYRKHKGGDKFEQALRQGIKHGGEIETRVLPAPSPYVLWALNRMCWKNKKAGVRRKKFVVK